MRSSRGHARVSRSWSRCRLLVLCALVCVPALHAFSHAIADGQRPGQYIGAEGTAVILLEHGDPAICPHCPPVVRPTEPVSEQLVPARHLSAQSDFLTDQDVGLYTLLSAYRI